jgi:phosphoribosyl 1,2-cyclic phosphate phosphodiesterase
MIGCRCNVCTSSDEKNKRRRCGLYVVAGDRHLIFDTPPDFRDQVLRFGVKRVDAVFLTHAHADHIFGFDDVRRFSTLQEQHIPVYGSPETIRLMQGKFEYVNRCSYSFESVPRVHFIEQIQPVETGGAVVMPLPVKHGQDTVYGFRIDENGTRIAYIPDCSLIPDATLCRLKSLDAMILDGLRPQPHPTHFSIDEAVKMLHQIGAGRSFITHLTHDSEHHALQARLGDDVTVPWDGMQVVLP